MGTFIYEGAIRADFDDRLLAHLQSVIGSKLRRGEGFHFGWPEMPEIGSGRTTVWVHAQASLVYRFTGAAPQRLNRSWVDALTSAADSKTGLRVVPEPDDDGDTTRLTDEAPGWVADAG